jgi:tetrapyrrole methylase family protein/MazG family protein
MNDFKELLSVVETLRSDEGCPWDKKQTYDSLKGYFIEEASELFDAVVKNDVPNMVEELGDLQMLILLVAQIAKEKGDFEFDDIARLEAEKMIRRHPHVFSGNSVDSADEVVDLWESIKKEEKPNRTDDDLFADIPTSLPPMVRALEVQKKVAKLGFEWQSELEIIEKIEEELEELRVEIVAGDDKKVEEELGDLLFVAICLSRYRGGSHISEIMLNSIAKFESRFRCFEQLVSHDGNDIGELSPEQLKKYWQKVKKNLEK